MPALVALNGTAVTPVSDRIKAVLVHASFRLQLTDENSPVASAELFEAKCCKDYPTQ